MLRRAILIIFIGASLVISGGFSKPKMPAGSYQPQNERQAQDNLPQSHDQLWAVFAKCRVNLNQKNYTYSINYTPQIAQLNGKQVTISGFILPLESSNKFRHFLLSKRTPTCPFCPPGEPNEIVEVYSKTPIAWSDGLVKFTGTFGVTNNPEMGLFFQLKNAQSNNPGLFDNLNFFGKPK